MNKIEKEKELMISQIKEYAPIFKKFFDMDISLAQYSKGIYDFKYNQTYIKRQKILKEEILNKFKLLFGKDCEKKLHINFDEQLVINIVDHHQILNHPLVIADNIIANVGKFNCKSKQDAIIVISSGVVPPNNYFNKNGFELHGKKVPIFNDSEKSSTSYFLPKRDFNFIEKLKKAKRWNEFNDSEKDFLIDQYDNIKNLDFSNCQDYNDQISIVIKNIWPYLFEQKLRDNLPELLFMSQEELVSKLLPIILKQDNFIRDTLFNKFFRDKVIKNFCGIVVAWNEDVTKGTHLFWRKHPTENKSLRMRLDGDKLVPVDANFKELSFRLEYLEICRLLESKEIYPNLFLIYSILDFYFGIKPLAGQGSIVYLNLIRDNWIKTLGGTNFQEEIDNIKSFNIDYMIAGVALLYEKNNNSIKTLYAYDVIYNGGVEWKYLNKIFDKKFNDLLSISVVGIYDYVSKNYIPENKVIQPKVTSDVLAKEIIDWL